jgi:hypothetical protein
MIGALLTCVLTLAACTATGDGPSHGADSTQPPKELLDTSTVLFPLETLNEQVIENQKAEFFTHRVDIEPLTVTATVSAEVYSGPGATFAIVDILLTGDAVVVDAQLAHWYRIANNGGYVSALRVTPAGSGGEAGPPDGVIWTTTVTNAGSDAAVDACSGGLTSFTDIWLDTGEPFWAVHSYCGGDAILELDIGQVISVDGAHYAVVSVNDAPLFGSTNNMEGMEGDAFLYTDIITADTARLVGLTETH